MWNLKGLALVNTGIEGVIPKEIGYMVQLQGLELSGNRLVGPLPDLSMLGKLDRLFLNDNYLMGEISTDRLNLLSLEKISLADNAFHGCIPTQLAEIQENDLDQVGLEFCPVLTAQPSG